MRKDGCGSVATYTRQAVGLALLGTVLLTAGCSSLPRINPDMALETPEDVELAGARGPLSTRQSQAILKKLRREGKGRAWGIQRRSVGRDSIGR